MASEKKEQVLTYAKKYEKEHGFAPSRKEVSEALGIKIQTVGSYLKRFETEGLISEYKRERSERKSNIKKYDEKLIDAIFARDIERAKRAYAPGKKIRVLKKDELTGDVLKETYEVVRHFKNIILIRGTAIERAKEQGVKDLKRLERLYTATITNAQLVMYIRKGKRGIIL